MDVHKKSIDVAVTDERANGKVRSYGKIDGTLEALDKLIRKLNSTGSDLHFVYEAGPCGYPIYRHLTSKGQLRDEYKSCGNQHANISMIHRR